MTSPGRGGAEQRGFALVPTLLLVVLLLTLGSAALLFSTIDLRSTSHYRTGNQAFFAAEAGLVHALSTMNTRGVQNFSQDIAPTNVWSALYGSATKTIPNYADYSYTVSVAADATDPANKGTITATGGAPLQAQRVLRVAVKRSGIGGSPGAVYLAADTIQSSQFTGNKFSVDGNDHTIIGTANPSGPIMPGISTRNDGVTGTVTSSLSSGQKDNVTGLGFSLNPLTPSVLTTSGPSVNDLDTISSSILAKSGVVTNNTSKFNGNDTFGTLANPQITHLTNSDVRLNGNAQGVGILIVDGSLTINGDLNFVGWIIVRGATTVNPVGNPEATSEVTGSAQVYGSLWTGDLAIKIGGDATLDYSQAALNLIDNVGGGGGNLARPMSIVSWQEL
jgi:PilX N-terminal